MPRKGAGRSGGVALGGILSALALVVLLAGGVIPVGTFAAPIFAGICLVPVAVELGAKWALLCYAAVSALAALMVPDRELVLFFILLTGYYPILHPRLQKIGNRALRLALKLLLFNAAVAAVYALMFFLFTSPALMQELAGRGQWFWALLLAGGNLTFLLYNRLLLYVRPLYLSRIRRHLRR